MALELATVEPVAVTVSTVVAPLVVKTDEKGRFIRGNPGGPGRPKGMKNAENALLRAAPRLVKAYIKTALAGNPTLLKDSREWIMPIESDSAQGGAPTLVNILFSPSLPIDPPSVNHEAMPLLPVDDASAASMPASINPPEIMSYNTDSVK